MSGKNLPACSLVSAYTQTRSTADELTRPRGRPKTRTSEHYHRLFEEHQAMTKWFIALNGRPADSDRELLTTYIVASLEELNMRASRVTSNEFKGRLKTLRNEFSTARRLFGGCPEKATFHGTANELQTSMQQRTLTGKEAL